VSFVLSTNYRKRGLVFVEAKMALTRFGAASAARKALIYFENV
jgi:hypothetical protein